MSFGAYDGPFIGDGETNPTNWRKGKMFAQGGFGKVSHVVSGPLKNTKCVVKQLPIADDHKKETLEKTDAETRALKIVKHERIVDYYGFCRTPGLFSLFLEFMEKGTLAKYIQDQRKGKLSEERTALFTYQILEGLVYLHEQRIIHRDIKGSNILMRDENNIKISDFGVAKILNTISRASTSKRGTLNFMAPEIIHDDTSYNNKVDIWSLGCTVFQMITGTMPFLDISENTIIKKALQNAHELPIPENSSVNLTMFLKQTCEKDPSKRPTAKEAMHHLFLRDVDVEQTSVMKVGERLDEEGSDGPSIGSVNQSMSAIGFQQPGIHRNGAYSQLEIDGEEWGVTEPVHGTDSQRDDVDNVKDPQSDRWKAKIRANYDLLVTEIIPKDVLPRLFQEELISLDEKDELGKKKRSECVERLLGIILRKGESDCANFVEILKDRGYKQIYEVLVNTEIKVQPATLSASWFDQFPHGIKNEVVSEIDASRLATILGNNWESVLTNLGFGKAQIDQEFQSNGSNTQRTISNMLIKWKQRKGKNATFSNLINVFRESEKNNNAFIDWDRLQTFF